MCALKCRQSIVIVSELQVPSTIAYPPMQGQGARTRPPPALGSSAARTNKHSFCKTIDRSIDRRKEMNVHWAQLSGKTPVAYTLKASLNKEGWIEMHVRKVGIQLNPPTSI